MFCVCLVCDLVVQMICLCVFAFDSLRLVAAFTGGGLGCYCVCFERLLLGFVCVVYLFVRCLSDLFVDFCLFCLHLMV